MEAAVAEQGPEYPVAYRIEYNDGTRATMLLMTGLVGDFNFAAKLHGCARQSLYMYMYLLATIALL